LIVNLESNRIINHDWINFTRFSSRGTNAAAISIFHVTIRTALLEEVVVA